MKTDQLTDKQKQTIDKYKKQQEQADAVGFLLIENFGAIGRAEILVKKLTLLTGENNTGKSTVAKLISIFSELSTFSLDEKGFVGALSNFDIAEFLRSDSRFIWVSTFGDLVYQKGRLYSEFSLPEISKEQLSIYATVIDLLDVEKDIETTVKEAIQRGVETEKLEKLQLVLSEISDIKEIVPNIKRKFEVLYVPAERDFISIIADSTFSLLQSKLPVSSTILNFAAKLERAKKKKRKLDIDFLKIKYQWEEEEDRIYLSKGNYININNAASGVKSVLPAYIALSTLEKSEKATLVVFEEPENNLHPTAQKEFSNTLSRFCLQGNIQLLAVTTHSPYILSAFNNLIQAGSLAAKKPELKAKIAKIIPKESWIEFKDVGAYRLDDGKAYSITDSEWEGIVAEEIDKASDEISEEYEKILDLKHG